MASEAPMSRRNLELVRSSSEVVYRDVMNGRMLNISPEFLGELLIKARFSGPEAETHVPIWDRGHIVGAMTQAAADKIVSSRAKHSISGSFTRPEENADNKAHALDLYPVAAEPEKPAVEVVGLRLMFDASPLVEAIERELAKLPASVEVRADVIGPGAPRR